MMQTLLTMTYKNISAKNIRHINSSVHGFTLIELVVVIFIISLFSALVMPSLWDRGDRALLSESKRLATTLRYIYDESVSKKEPFRLKFDLNLNRWEYISKKDSKSFELDKAVVFRDVTVPSEGEVSAGELILDFGPLGPEEPLTIHLAQDNIEYTISFNHINGRTKIHKEYLESGYEL